MKVKLAELRQTLIQIAHKHDIPKNEANDYAEAIVAHYLEDNYFKGFRGVHGIDDWIKKLESSKKAEELLFESESVSHFDSNGKGPFHIIMQRFNDICSSASKNGTYTVTVKGQYMTALFYTVRKFADKGYIAVLASNGGPQGTVPYGGKDDIFGTNPLAYGIPSSSDSIVFDAATSKRAWGLIDEAKKANTQLPEDTYFDQDGKYTTDPNKAVKIEGFGGYKGYSINLLLEILTSALVGGVAGKAQSNTEELGTWLYVIDPAVFGSKEKFIEQVDRIKSEITSTEPREGFERVVYPGQRANEHAEGIKKSGNLEIADDIWQKLLKFAEEQ